MSEGRSKAPHKGRSWIHTLYFNAFFEDALVKARVDTGLGETYAIFNALNEYWHEHGYMTEEGYEFNRERYNLGLVEEFKRKLDANDNAGEQKTRRQAKIEETLETIYREWDSPTTTSKAREYAVEKAREHPEFPISERVLEKAEKPFGLSSC